MLRPVAIDHLASDHFEIALGAPMSAAQVAAVDADHDRGRHQVDVRIGSSGGTPAAPSAGSMQSRGVACKFLNAKLRAFGKETALWGSWFGG